MLGAAKQKRDPTRRVPMAGVTSGKSRLSARSGMAGMKVSMAPQRPNSFRMPLARTNCWTRAAGTPALGRGATGGVSDR